MKTFTNVDCDKLVTFLESFSSDWTTAFLARMNDELKSSLNSLISNRNNIAHGNTNSITFNKIKRYCSK